MIKKKAGKPQIDLTSPQGNAFSLIGLARTLGKKLDRDESQLAAITAEMMSGDYENLIQVFDREFGDLVDLVR